MLSEIVGDVTIDPAIIEPDPNLRPKAPGMKYTHYAPHGTLSIVEAVADESANRASLHSGVKVSYNATEAETLRVAEKIKALVNEKEAQGYKVAILTTKEHASLYKNYSHVLIVGEECVAYKYGDIQYFRNEEKSTGYRVWSGRWKSCDCSCL